VPSHERAQAAPPSHFRRCAWWCPEFGEHAETTERGGGPCHEERAPEAHEVHEHTANRWSYGERESHRSSHQGHGPTSEADRDRTGQVGMPREHDADGCHADQELQADQEAD